MTFTLPGFSTVKRDGIELTADFTAPVNIEMKVGGVEETITVSGASPIVDVQTTQRRDVLTRDVLDVLPTGRNYQTIGAVLPGVTMGRFDVGGSTTMQQGSVMSNGSLGGDMALLVDGMNIQSSLNTGSTPAVYHNDDAYQEYVFQVSGGAAESQSGGVVINMIPKEGSNQFKGDGLAVLTNGNFRSVNVSDEQRQRGVSLPAKLDKIWDFAGSVGFPIVRDRVWWFSSFRNWGYNNFAPNAFNADGSQAVDDNRIQAYTNRVTFQINSKNAEGERFVPAPVRNPFEWRVPERRRIRPGRSGQHAARQPRQPQQEHELHRQPDGRALPGADAGQRAAGSARRDLHAPGHAAGPQSGEDDPPAAVDRADTPGGRVQRRERQPRVDRSDDVRLGAGQSQYDSRREAHPVPGEGTVLAGAPIREM